MSLFTLKHCKFRVRAWMTRLGLWERFERLRLRRRYRRGFLHEPDFRFYRNFDGSRGLFVDVGANIGQSALSFRVANRTSPILSFEANGDMEFGLRETKKLLGDGFDYRMHGLGSTRESRTLFVPYVKGTPFPQLATFHRARLEDEAALGPIFHQHTGTSRFSIAEAVIELVPFDELGHNPTFVKIDVEGGEPDVLEGMKQTLDRCRPLLMTEGNACTPFLSALDYDAFIYQPGENRLQPLRDDEDALNYFFIPRERVASLSRLGLS